MTVRTPTTAGSTRVLPLTRLVAFAIVPFLLVAVAVLYPVPSDTQRLFAWTIRPTLTAMVLGSAYLGGAYFFLRAGLATTWHTVKGGFVPVAVFASLMGTATIIHWDKFNHRHVAFWLWTFLYFTTPFLVVWVWLRNRRYDLPAAPDERRLTPPAARAIAVVGGLAVVVGLFLFLAPSVAVQIWPWSLTPLTARVLGGVFCLGLAGLGALVDSRWSSARVPLQVALVMLTMMVVAGLRAYRQIDATNPVTWLFAIGFVGLTLAILVLYRRMERAT
jgi:hypothetical protein